ncbi:MAG: formylmethanofuran dehydrogenase subunit C [Promethearchaeota archaeon]
MAEVTLTMREKSDMYVEVDCVTPDKFAGKSADEIKKLPVWLGNREMTLGDFFDVSGSPGATAEETKIVLKGPTDGIKRVGEGMTAGEIVVEGNVGMHVGAKLKGGKITVKGDADDWAGAMMQGGELVIEGNAAHYCGAAYRGEWIGMKNGVITVKGTVGNDAMAWARNSKGAKQYPKLVCGGAGMFLGLHNHGGTIVVNGDVGRRCGADMARGSIVVNGKVEMMLPSFEKVEDAKDPELPNGDKVTGEYETYRGDLAIGLKNRKVFGKIFVKK